MDEDEQRLAGECMGADAGWRCYMLARGIVDSGVNGAKNPDELFHLVGDGGEPEFIESKRDGCVYPSGEICVYRHFML